MYQKAVSALGLVVFILVAWAMSTDRRRVPWRVIIWGLILQLGLAVVLLHTSAGRAVFNFAGLCVQKLIQFSGEGTQFVFGPLGDAECLARAFGARHTYVLAILITGTIIIVSTLSSVLYHWGVLQRVVHFTAKLMHYVMRTSGSETLSAIANIFMGQTEAPLLVKPYISKMTQSELLCMMTGGMATIAGGVGAVYTELGRQAGYLDMAGHLLTASVLSAPAALMVSKLLMPETQLSETAGRVPPPVPRTTTNTIDAMCRGASDGLILSLNVLAMLIAFVAAIAMLNYVFVRAQTIVGIANPVTIQTVVGWLNAPCAWLMGIPTRDCLLVGQALGERIVLNEFIGYVTLTSHAMVLSTRGFVLAVYALCGFANFGSVAIQVGGIGALVPERRGDLARLGLKSMIGGVLACYITACIVGMLL